MSEEKAADLSLLAFAEQELHRARHGLTSRTASFDRGFIRPSTRKGTDGRRRVSRRRPRVSVRV
jgi:hypothetical protein